MSFIDLMGTYAWTDSDIDNRVQALIRGVYSAEEELKAARLARKPSLDPDETAFIARVDAVIEAAVQEGRAAREDMARLKPVLDFEKQQQEVAAANNSAVQQNKFLKAQYLVSMNTWLDARPEPAEPSEAYTAALATWEAAKPADADFFSPEYTAALADWEKLKPFEVDPPTPEYEAALAAWQEKKPAPSYTDAYADALLAWRLEKPVAEGEDLMMWTSQKPADPAYIKVPALLPDPTEGDAIYETWRLRHPAPPVETLPEPLPEPLPV